MRVADSLSLVEQTTNLIGKDFDLGFERPHCCPTIAPLDASPNVQHEQEAQWQNRVQSGRLPPRSADVKRCVRKGIPPMFRGQAWFEYSGAEQRMLQHPETFHDLMRHYPSLPNDTHADAIDQDLLRTFPENRYFKTQLDHVDPTQLHQLPVPLERMRRILVAYSQHCPDIGYCQSLNYIVGLLVLHLDDDEKVFWMLDTLLHCILPTDMYSSESNLHGAKVDQEVLWALIRLKFPLLWRKVGPHEICSFEAPPASAITTPWFLKLFIDVLPLQTLLRVWDCLFYEGSKVLFRTALTILKLNESQIMACTSPLDVYLCFRECPKHLHDGDVFMEVCFKRFGGSSGGLPRSMIESLRHQQRGLPASVRSRMRTTLLHPVDLFVKAPKVEKLQQSSTIEKLKETPLKVSTEKVKPKRLHPFAWTMKKSHGKTQAGVDQVHAVQMLDLDDLQQPLTEQTLVDELESLPSSTFDSRTDEPEDNIMIMT